MRIERHAGVIRFALAYLALQLGVVAVYILIAPRSFYDDFPAGSSEWVSALPPYNEHLIRDFGSAGLGLAVLAILAAVWMERRVVQAAAIAIFLGSLPHAIFHFTKTEALSTLRQRREPLRPLAAALLPLAILYLASGRRQEPEPVPA